MTEDSGTQKTGRLGTKPEDFAVHGIVQGSPEVWEDGQRLEQLGPGMYEWWYCDARFSNGMILVAVFRLDGDERGAPVQQIWLSISDGDRVMADQRLDFKPEEVSADKERCDVSIGSSHFRSVDGLDTYEIFVDPATNNGFGADVKLERTVTSYRPGTGFWENEDGEYFAWFDAVPGGRMTGTVTANGETSEVEGSGYHDHNWGNVPMDVLFSDWLWGRAEIDGTTVVMATVRFNENNGAAETPLIYVAKGEDVIVDAVNDEVVSLDGVKVRHPDTGKRINSDCIFIVREDLGDATVRFAGHDIISTQQFPSSSAEWEAWYLRFAAETTLDIRVDGKEVQAKGPSVLESMDFFGRKI
jgi:hypothetical protein